MLASVGRLICTVFRTSLGLLGWIEGGDQLEEGVQRNIYKCIHNWIETYLSSTFTPWRLLNLLHLHGISHHFLNRPCLYSQWSTKSRPIEKWKSSPLLRDGQNPAYPKGKALWQKHGWKTWFPFRVESVPPFITNIWFMTDLLRGTCRERGYEQTCRIDAKSP